MEDHDGYYDNNWDLHAVVRAAFRRRLSPPPGPISPFLPLPPPPPQQSKAEEPDLAWRFPDLARGADELYVAFLASSAPTPQPPPATPPDGPHQTAARTQQRGQPSGRPASGAAPRSKRRKSQQKKVVCHVPADGVSADLWAWRKYGQKPIKGSPYPRGYYRCSSSKACVARKQVERSRDNPNTFVITYTGEHSHPAPTHRNSLAGTTRHKFPTASAPPPEAQASPPSTSAGLSPTTPLREPSMDGEAEDEEDDDDDEGMLLVEDMEMVAEDELLFLAPDAAFDGGSGGTGCNGAAAMAALFDADGPDEPFFVSPWVGTTGTTAARGPS